ncbi:hypothetical protein D9M71_430130 [compost metagenome]
MPQQLVASGMPAGVIDQLELIQVQKHQGMVPRLPGQPRQCSLQPVLELAAVGKARQGIMARLPGQVIDVLAFQGHVVQHQHGAADLPPGLDRRADQGHRHRAAIQALDQLGMLAGAAQLTAEDALDQGEVGFIGMFVQQAEQRCQRQALGLLGIPQGQLLGCRVHVGDRTVYAGGDHSIADGLEGDLGAFAFFLQGAGKSMALRQQFLRAPQRQENQHQGCDQVGRQEHVQQKARAFA